MQDSLFDDADALPLPRREGSVRHVRADAQVRAAPVDPAQRELAVALPQRLHMGTSSWNFPGWQGLVWDDEYDASALSRRGLAAYAQQPLLRTVGIDRSFYRPLTAAQFAHYAAQVPPGFRFVVKAPSLVADALLRDKTGRGMQPNNHFLNPAVAIEQFIQPALEGLGDKLGALVFQLSPLSHSMLQPAHLEGLMTCLRSMLLALPSLLPRAPDAVVAVEVRNAELLTPALADVLRECRATYCLGLHPRLPSITEQLPLLRALWPGPLVCRWNLNRLHGALGYEDARALYRPFNKLIDPDPALRSTLARVIVGTTSAGYQAYVTVNNKAEGSAPLSVQALAQEVRRQQN